MRGLLNHSELNRFAEELVQGSIDPVRTANITAKGAYWAAYGHGPTPEQSELIEGLFPWHSDRYDIGPYGVKVVTEGDMERTFGLGEFISGIAVANGIEPSVREVETVIFNIGKLMGKLEQ